jgi:hypothetical protein
MMQFPPVPDITGQTTWQIPDQSNAFMNHAVLAALGNELQGRNHHQPPPPAPRPQPFVPANLAPVPLPETSANYEGQPGRALPTNPLLLEWMQLYAKPSSPGDQTASAAFGPSTPLNQQPLPPFPMG